MDIIHSSDTLYRMLGEDQEDFITPGTGNIKSIKCLIPLPCTSAHVESPSGGQNILMVALLRRINEFGEGILFVCLILFVFSLCVLSLRSCTGISLVTKQGDYTELELLLCRARAPECMDFSGCSSWALESGLNSCGTRS